MSVITGIFNVLALLYIGRALLLVVQIGRNWHEWRQEPLTRAKQQQSEQAAFFLGVPPAVLVHELAHAVAIWLFGGQVVEFGYRVFWGYVVPQGTFTPTQNWIIALAGTLGSLAFGAALWLLLRGNRSSTLRYFGLRAFRFQIYFALLYYPLMTLILPIGDWRMIYDFAATPWLSGAMAVIHAGLLLWFWRVDRTGGFEMPAYETLNEQARHGMVATAAGDPYVQLYNIRSLEKGGARHQAERALDALLAAHPNFAAAHLQRAGLLATKPGTISREAADAARRALALGLERPIDVAVAHIWIALYALERGDGRAAEATLDEALRPTPTYDPELLSNPQRAEIHFMRSQAYRRQGRYDDAFGDIDLALQLSAGRPEVIARLLQEREVIEKHAGRKLSAGQPAG